MKITLIGNTPAKKDSARIVRAGGRIVLLPSARHERWYRQNAAALGVRIIRGRVRPEDRLTSYSGVSLPLPGRTRISIRFYRDSRRRWDYSNALDAVQDLLVDFGILSDDNAEVLCLGDITHEYDKLNPRAEVTLEADR